MSPFRRYLRQSVEFTAVCRKHSAFCTLNFALKTAISRTDGIIAVRPSLVLPLFLW